jgi:hypothetical protein
LLLLCRQNGRSQTEDAECGKKNFFAFHSGLLNELSLAEEYHAR